MAYKAPHLVTEKNTTEDTGHQNKTVSIEGTVSTEIWRPSNTIATSSTDAMVQQSKSNINENQDYLKNQKDLVMQVYLNIN